MSFDAERVVEMAEWLRSEEGARAPSSVRLLVWWEVRAAAERLISYGPSAR